MNRIQFVYHFPKVKMTTWSFLANARTIHNLKALCLWIKLGISCLVNIQKKLWIEKQMQAVKLKIICPYCML